MLTVQPSWAGKKKDEAIQAAKVDTLVTLALRDGRFGVRVPAEEASARLQTACDYYPLACTPDDIEPFKTACEAGDVRACVVVGWSESELRLNVPSPDAPDPKAASAHFSKGCTGGLPEACMSLAKLFLRGVGVEQNVASAEQLYGRMCEERAHPFACATRASMSGNAQALEEMVEAGNPVASAFLADRVRSEDAERARSLYQSACDAGAGAGCVGVAHLDHASDASQGLDAFETGCERGNLFACEALGNALVGTDAKRADELLSEGCAVGYGEACQVLAVHVAGGGLPGGDARVAEVLGRACELGQTRACGRLARAMQSGLGVDKDAEGAAKLFRRACKAGEDTACFDLASAYLDGVGVHRDAKKARELLTGLCEEDNAPGCTRLGETWPVGVTGPMLEQRRAALQQACDLGDAGGCFHLSGTFGDKDQDKMIDALGKACEGHFAQACTGLGVIYVSEDSEPTDKDKGLSLLRDACAAGDPAGCIALSGGADEGASDDALEKVKATLGGKCEEGDLPSCSGLGHILYQSDQAKEGFDLLDRACNEGFVLACGGYADILLTGAGGVPKNERKALDALRQGCDEEKIVCAWLGSAVMNGFGTQDDMRFLRQHGMPF